MDRQIVTHLEVIGINLILITIAINQETSSTIVPSSPLDNINEDCNKVLVLELQIQGGILKCELNKLVYNLNNIFNNSKDHSKVLKILPTY